MKKHLLLLIFAINSLICFAQSPAWLPVNGLVSWFPFNGNAHDSMGNSNNDTVYGAVLTTDRFGNANSAYSFDGVNDYIKADADNLPIAARTVSLWFYANRSDNRPGLLGYGGQYCGQSWLMAINLSGQPSYSMTSHCNVNTIQYSYPADPIGNWYHFVVTTDSSGTKMYVNGVEQAFNTNFVNNTYVINKNLSFGSYVSPGGIAPFEDVNIHYLDGKIDEIGIWNRALTQCEIHQLYYNSLDSSITINQQPSNQQIISGNSVDFFVSSFDTCLSFQWQQDTGLGFVNLSNTGLFNGVNTDTLTINPVTMSMNNFHYRCIISSCLFCPNITNEAILDVATGKNELEFDLYYDLFPNPFTNEIKITLKNNEPYKFIIYDITSRKVLMHDIATSCSINTKQLAKGIYIYELRNNNGLFKKGKIIKD